MLLERLEDRRVLVADWQNSSFPEDVSHDGLVSPLDVVLVVNELNRRFANGSGSALPTGIGVPPPYVDVNGDSRVTALDVLFVINYLNSGADRRGALTELSRFDSFRNIRIDLSSQEGARLYRMQVNASFGADNTDSLLPDLFSVYLRDPDNPGQTLLDRGVNGTSLFSLSSRGAELATGLVRWDGNILELDLSSIKDKASGHLYMELLNGDPASRSRVSILPLENRVDPDAPPGSLLPANSDLALPGTSLNFTQLTRSQAFDVDVENMRFNSTNNLFIAELDLVNRGEATGRDLAIVIGGLPSGATLLNASGIDPQGRPYLNMRNAIRRGGLGANERSSLVEIRIANASRIPLHLTAEVYVGDENRPPVIAPIAAQSVVPGAQLNIQMNAIDADGDQLTYSMRSAEGSRPLPTGGLDAATGLMVFSPAPEQLGSYQVEVFASDGKKTASQSFALSIVEDTSISTRIAGRVLDVNDMPLPGLVVEIGGVQVLTQADGRFEIDLGAGPLVSDTLKVRGDTYMDLTRPDVRYPFIAEKLPFMLGREVYRGFRNILERAIYLPTLNAGSPVNPTDGTVIRAELRPNQVPVEVHIAAGTLFTQQGAPFAGNLSITEVPIDRTPAALPSNLFPDMLITIQPGEMVFSSPAPLTFPNTAGWAPGVLMDLWSINPVTGEFEIVGAMRVSADGRQIETISGGIRNSSWHFPAPPPPPAPPTNDNNDDDDCDECEEGGPGSSLIMFQTGALMETHDLVSYQSLGASRGFVLNYDSLRADPRPIIHTAIENVDPAAIGGANADNLRLVARLRMQQGNVSASVPGYEGNQFGLLGGENFWSLPTEPGTVDAALQVDMRLQPTGKYDYVFSTGVRLFSEDSQRFGGSESRQDGHILHVNTIDSPFGSGWGLAGHEQIVENPDGTAMIVDGDGSELLFRPSGAAEVRDFLLPDGPNNSILRYDGLTGALQGTFVASGAGGLTGPHNPTFGPDGNLYVLSNANSRVLRFDGQTGEFIDVFMETGGGGFTSSAQMAFGPDGHLYFGSGAGVFKVDGTTGTSLGMAAFGNEIQRACGIAFGPDGNLYVGDSDPFRFTGYDRILRFDTEGNFIDVFVPSGNLEDTCPIDFGADGNLYIADQQTRDVRKFDGATGTFMGVFAVSPGLGTPFRATSGIDGNLYVGIFQPGTPGSIARVDGTTGRFIDSFIGNNTGFGTFFPGPEVLPFRRVQDLLIQDATNDTVMRYDGITGERIGQLVGRGAGGLDLPHNPTFGPDGNMYVFRGTPEEQQILRFNGRTGSFMDVFVDTGVGGFAGGTEMLFDSEGNLYVATGGTEVLRFDANGAFKEAIGGTHVGLQSACGIEIGSTGELLVYDTFDEEMRVFSLESGELIRVLIPSSDNLVNACDFDIGADGDIFITDATLGGVRRFDGQTGEFLGVFAITSSTVVSGITIGPNGDLYVNVNGNTDRFSGQTGVFVERFVTGNGGFVNFIPPSPAVAESIYLSPVGDFSTLEKLIDGSFRRTMKDKAVYLYDNSGQLVQSIDRNNNVTQWLYDEAGNFTHWVDPVGLVTTFSYTEGKATSITDPAGRITQLQYDTVGNLTSIIDPDGSRRTFEYDANRLMTAETDQRGNREQAIYNFAGRVERTLRKDGTEINLSSVQVRGLHPAHQTKDPFSAPLADGNLAGQSTYIDSNGNVQTTTVDGLGQRTAANDSIGLLPSTQFDMATNLPSQDSDARGNITNYTYDSRGNLIRMFDSLNPQNPSLYTYESEFNRLTSATDELGRQTLYDIDPLNGNVRSITQVLGSLGEDDLVTHLQYTTRGLVKSITDPLGRVSESFFDSLGRLTQHAFSSGTSSQSSVRYEYDLAGNVSATTDENGNRSLFQYDALNRLMKVTEADPDGSGPLVSPATRLEYDAVGNLVALTDQRSNRTEFEYDQLNRLIRVVDSKGQVSNWTYDRVGNLLSSRDPLSQITRFVYDARNRLVEKIEPDGTRARFEYDLDDNLIAISDLNGNATRYAHDARNRVVDKIDELGNSTSYAYDLSDNLISTQDRMGRVTTFEYDDANRLVAESWGEGGNVIQFSYDAVGNLITLMDQFSALSFQYDSRDRVVSVDNAGTPKSPHVVLNYQYDSVGNLLSVVDTIDGEDGGSMTYHFDALNRVEQITQTGANTNSKRVNFGYDALGQFMSIHRYSDLAGTLSVVDTVFSYDELNRLLQIDHVGQNASLAFFDFDYDAVGRITRISGIDGETVYDYDTRGQLVSAVHADLAKPLEQYAYDANGNRVSATVLGIPLEYQTGLNNQVLSDGRYNFVYDRENNLSRRTEIDSGIAREFSWDNRNRLTAVSDRNAEGAELQRVEFTYDPLDRRISKSVETDVDEVIYHFVYDRDNVLLDFIDADGAVGASPPALAIRYLHGPDVDQVLAQDDGKGNVHWMLADHLGTVTHLVNSLGAVDSQLRYDSYGNVVAQSNELISTRFQFTGREFDTETGLQFNRTRYYDPSIGKFISEDLAGFLADSFNLHAYVDNEPTRLRDAFGLKGSAGNDPTGLGDLGESLGGLIPDAGSMANSGSDFLIGLLPNDGHLGRLKDLLTKAREATNIKQKAVDIAQKKLEDAIKKNCTKAQQEKLREALKKAKAALEAQKKIGIDLQREIVNQPGYQQYSQMFKRWRLDMKKQIARYNIQ